MKTIALLALSAALAASAAHAHAAGFFAAQGHLSPAPRLLVEPEAVESAPAPKAVQSVGPIDTSSIAAVLAAYNQYYNVPMPALGFTGSVAGCNPGSISLAWQEWLITRINFMRAMAGVPGNTTLDASRNAAQQAAALIMAANGVLDHNPPSSYACWTSAGANAAGGSNLSYGSIDPLPLYMSEPGAGNEPVGHRRWILDSRKNNFGVGQVNDFNALYAFQRGSAVSVPNGIAWPPRGYVPLALFPTAFTSVQRWSFGLPGADFGPANVTVTRNGAPVAVNVVSRFDTGYADNTIVWEMPANHSITAGAVYQVTVSNVANAASTSYTYPVRPFDPSNVANDLAVTQAVSPNPATGRDIVYTLIVSNAGGTTAGPVTLTDTLPSGTTFVWASPGCLMSAGVVTCTNASLAAGGTWRVQVVVRRANSGNITNSASVSSPLGDTNAANNSTSLQSTVAASSAGVPVLRYRLYSDVSKEHHFTTDLNEYNVLGTMGWVREGTVGRVLDNPGQYNGVAAVPYYRLYDNSTAWHHWTTDANEYYTLAQYPWWSAEGIDGFILPTQAPGTIPLYRLNYSAIPTLHHWTIDANEYNTLICCYGWFGEGGSGFVIP